MAYKKGRCPIPKSRFFSIAAYMTFYPVWAIAFLVDWFMYRVTIKNRFRLLDHFWLHKKAIIVSNHTTVFDPVKMCACVAPYSIYHTLLQATVATPILGTFIQLLGGFPMPSMSKGQEHFVKDFRAALSKRPAIHVYPEGECFLQSGEVGKFHHGAFIASMELKVPIFPIATVFSERKKFLGYKSSFPKATLYILPPIFPDKFETAKDFADFTRDTIQAEITKHNGTNKYAKGPMARIKGVN